MVVCVEVGKVQKKQGNCGKKGNKREDKHEAKAEIYNMNMVGEVGGSVNSLRAYAAGIKP